MNNPTIYEQLPAVKAPEIEIYYKTPVFKSERPRISQPDDIYNLMFTIGEMSRNMEYKELFYSLYLNNDNDILAVHKISEGTTKSTLVDTKFIMQGAIMTNAAALVICHNHPGGNTQPSAADKRLTQKIQQAAQLFDINLLDSVIITADNYFSMRAEGML